MAQRTITTLIDDLDGTTADETVSFSLDGADYEIDLTAENAAKLRDALGPWTGHARRSGGRRAGGRRPRGGSGGSGQAARMRDWARANGYTVSDRGRIPSEVAAAYAKAN